ncbi:folylpolyglutamate synthase/dihydrofolate synthase [Microbacterium sp. W4I4]|nr:folylpolyglutamate synthase/dihydrofolate synthase [Microbacterium sp. W4I4]
MFAPIAMDHADRLGDTIEKIAEVKAGIIKDGAAVVSAEQKPEVEAVLRRVAVEKGATLALEGDAFGLSAQTLAVGGQLISIKGLAGQYPDEYLPLYGAHQGHNAALAVAAVESLIGGGAQPIASDIVTDGLQGATSPGRLQLVGIAPTVVVDAAHNPHGAQSLARALDDSFDFDEWGLVVGIFADKDTAGIVDALLPAVGEVFATSPDSDRAADADAIADLVEEHGRRASVHATLAEAVDAAREWAASSERRAVVIAGSIVLAGEALRLSEDEDWKSGWRA